MIYAPKISPFELKQVVSGDNRPFSSEDYTRMETCRRFKVNEAIIFQFQSDTVSPDVYVNDTSLTPSNITPAGWSGEGTYVYQVSYTPASTGYIQFLIQEGGFFYESEKLNIVDSNDGILKIEYKNSENDYGYVGTSTLTSYQWGEMADAQPENEVDSFQNDRGNQTILRATPIEAYQATFYYCDLDTVNRLNMIFSCDDVKVNDFPCEVNEVINPERFDTSDMFTVTITLYRKDDDYNQLSTTDDGFEVITDDTDEILTDDINEILI